jgi:hypothetical protein
VRAGPNLMQAAAQPTSCMAMRGKSASGILACEVIMRNGLHFSSHR